MNRKAKTQSATSAPAEPAPKKQVVITAQAQEFIFDQTPFVISEFFRLIRLLEKNGRLEEPDGKKINARLFEMRVHSSDGQFRTFYCYAAGDLVYILSGFVKKTPKTPLAEIRKAEAIMRRIGG